MTDTRSARTRLALVVMAVTALSGFSLVKAIVAEEQSHRPTAATALDRGLELDTVLNEPHIVFRSTSPGPTYGRLAAVPLDDPGGRRSVTRLSCERVHASAVGGVCLIAERGAFTTYRAELLTADLTPRAEVPMTGIPSRARVSPDGSWVAMTSFVSGHSYASSDFSTRTTIVETATGRDFGNLEQSFRTTLDSGEVSATDLNIWGVTFASGPRPALFYATAATGGTTWLVRGDLRRRTLTGVRRDAECPSLSPDGRTLVYKKAGGVGHGWRYHVLDLATGSERLLSERRSVDDQVEWLDNSHVLYGIPRENSAEVDVWKASVRNTHPPRMLIRNAASPAVVKLSIDR